MGTSAGISVRPVGQGDLDQVQQRLVQICLDAFTTDGFAFNAQRATEDKAIAYLQSLLAQGAVAFFAFDSGKVAYPRYPLAFLFGETLSADPLLSHTRLALQYDVERSGYIAEIAVDRGHRGRGVGQRLVETYLAYCREHSLLDVLVRTNEADQHLHRFYGSLGFTKLEATARQELPTGDVIKRYFHQSMR